MAILTDHKTARLIFAARKQKQEDFDKRIEKAIPAVVIMAVVK